MDAVWPNREGRGRAEVEDAIAAARSSLRVAGFPVRGRRFPFPMHHDAYRVRLPRKPSGQRARHADVARLLNAWAVDRADPVDYAWQAVEGAVRSMIARSPALADRLPDDVREGIAKIGNGSEFLDWAAKASRDPA